MARHRHPPRPQPHGPVNTPLHTGSGQGSGRGAPVHSGLQFLRRTPFPLKEQVDSVLWGLGDINGSVLCNTKSLLTAS